MLGGVASLPIIGQLPKAKAAPVIVEEIVGFPLAPTKPEGGALMTGHVPKALKDVFNDQFKKAIFNTLE